MAGGAKPALLIAPSQLKTGVLRPQVALNAWLLLSVTMLSGCAGSPSGTVASQGPSETAAAIASSETPRADRALTLPSGATVKVPADWTVTTATDGVILLDPEKLLNPDGTTSFISVDPGVLGFEFNAPAATGVYPRLRLRDSQHSYDYESTP